MQDDPGSHLSPNEVTTTQSDIERAVVITRATMLCGDLGPLSGLSAHDIRAIVCAIMGADVRTKSPDYIHGAFDVLLDQRQPLPRPDAIPARK